MLRKASLLVIVLGLLAACSSPGTPTASTQPSGSAAASTSASTASTAPSGSASAGTLSSPSVSAASSPSSTSAASSPSASASPSASTGGSTGSSASASPGASGSAGAAIDDLGAQGPIVLQAIAQVAAQTGVQASSLSLQSAQETEWSDGSLGCPDPTKSYIQVITPGYKIVLTDGKRTYDIHASQQGKAVWCDNGTPKSLPGN